MSFHPVITHHRVASTRKCWLVRVFWPHVLLRSCVLVTKTRNVVQIERPNTSSRMEIKFERGWANPRTFGGKAVATQNSTMAVSTRWRRPIGCLIFIDHFPQKSFIIRGSFAKNDLQAICGFRHPVHKKQQCLYLQKKKQYTTRNARAQKSHGPTNTPRHILN